MVDAEKVSWGSLLLIALFEFRTVITLSLPMLDYLARHSYQSTKCTCLLTIGLIMGRVLKNWRLETSRYQFFWTCLPQTHHTWLFTGSAIFHAWRLDRGFAEFTHIHTTLVYLLLRAIRHSVFTEAEQSKKNTYYSVLYVSLTYVPVIKK